MPEGDTIWKLARRLRPLWVGEEVQRLAFRGRRSEVVPQRAVIAGVRSVGKHLLVELGRTRVLRVHLGLHGRFRELPSDAPLPSPRTLSLLVETPGHRVICTRARSVELFGAGQLQTHPVLSRLGPDLLCPPLDYPAILERFRARAGERTISDLLLDQQVAAGIGNVYRNELLFVYELHPALPAASVQAELVRQLYDRSAELLTANLDLRLRVTTLDGEGRPRRGVPRHFVYGRAGQRCLRCHGATIRAGARTREGARPTWWCPQCQPIVRRG